MSLFLEQLKAEWKAEAFSQGSLHGEAKGEAEMLLRQLRRRFHALPAEVETRIRTADSVQLDAWSERFVDTRSLTDIFDDVVH